MLGPFAPGTYSQPTSRRADPCPLVPGQRYRVIAPFTDFDGAVHSIGEQWYFIGSNFLPYDDGQSIFVADSERFEWHIRLCWTPDQQAHICEHLLAYVEPVVGDVQAE